MGQIKDGEFDWIITDIQMPDINGIDVFRVSKQEHPGIKVILMTAYASDDLVQEGIAECAVDVVCKPLDITHLLQLITS